MEAFDAAPAAELRPRLLRLTASPAWAEALLERRPFVEAERLYAESDALISALSEPEVDAALAGHPRIGERAGDLDEESAQRSAREQSGMSEAARETRDAMAEGNRAYEERFGRIYLVAAAGRSAEELLALLRERLDHDPATELDVVRRELARITRLRLGDLVGEAT